MNKKSKLCIALRQAHFDDEQKLKEIWNEKPEFKKVLSMAEEAKSLVVDCFRNGPLENLHGEGKVSQDEMKELMKYAVDRMFYWLWLKENVNSTYNLGLKANHLLYSNHWDEPDIDVNRNYAKISISLLSKIVKTQKGLEKRKDI